MAENKEKAQERENIAKGVHDPFDANRQTGSSRTLNKKLQAIKMGVLDHEEEVTPFDPEGENEAELERRVKAAEAYEDMQNKIIAERVKLAEAEGNADPVALERARLEKKVADAEEYERYSNAFVTAQNESKTDSVVRDDPVIREYETKAAFLSDRATPIEHRLKNELEKVVHENADDLRTSPDVQEVKAHNRALTQAQEEVKLARGVEKKETAKDN